MAEPASLAARWLRQSACTRLWHDVVCDTKSMANGPPQRPSHHADSSRRAIAFVLFMHSTLGGGRCRAHTHYLIQCIPQNPAIQIGDGKADYAAAFLEAGAVGASRAGRGGGNAAAAETGGVGTCSGTAPAAVATATRLAVAAVADGSAAACDTRQVQHAWRLPRHGDSPCLRPLTAAASATPFVGAPGKGCGRGWRLAQAF